MNKALPRLDLDFHFSRSSSWLGLVLLAIAFGFVADLGHSYLSARSAIAQKEARLAKLPSATSQSGDTGTNARLSRTIGAEELAAAKESLRQLSMPWNKLFQALEAANAASANEGGNRISPQRIALLAIEPEPDSGNVRISGEAPDYLAVLNYVLDLRRAGTLAEVNLVHHEQTAARGSVAFSISATWGEAKP